MRLNEFVDVCLESDKERTGELEAESLEALKGHLEYAYSLLSRVGLVKDMTPKQARAIYEIYRKGYNSGADVCFQDALEALDDMCV